MSFSQVAKNEICRIAGQDKCCQVAELSALIKVCGTISINGNHNIGFRITTENPAIARRIFSLLKNCFGINPDVLIKRNKQLKKNNIYMLVVTNDRGSVKILQESGVLADNSSGISIIYGIKKSLIEKDCCKRAYIRGTFLGGGSVTNPEKTYHLEFVNHTEEHAIDLSNLINSFELNSKVIQRKNSYVVYLKEGEQIVDLLNIIGAHKSLLNLENVRIYKEMRNNVNRLVNCETANLNKTVNAAVRQLECIKYIRDTIGLKKLPVGLRQVAEARLNNPDSSLKELGEMLDPPVGKSGVNHRLRKIEQFADELREK
ncbi:putative sporulation transcription regulator WhiA [Oxobacter pfennigii]|uniref:Probable cell division protein WhiA n=1 Tax=Oxobacter pfennigii TaxID=36849 RepID=A0A0P8YUR4_9CLOT|nr:DNA-binding protein WhiA [Oxobacter pfennigii]KPU43438.1 putative sporulation transcription regulator WhiA [Oxobacter pfennigii]